MSNLILGKFALENFYYSTLYYIKKGSPTVKLTLKDTTVHEGKLKTLGQGAVWRFSGARAHSFVLQLPDPRNNPKNWINVLEIGQWSKKIPTIPSIPFPFSPTHTLTNFVNWRKISPEILSVALVNHTFDLLEVITP